MSNFLDLALENTNSIREIIDGLDQTHAKLLSGTDLSLKESEELGRSMGKIWFKSVVASSALEELQIEAAKPKKTFMQKLRRK